MYKKSISEMTYFVSSGMYNINSIYLSCDSSIPCHPHNAGINTHAYFSYSQFSGTVYTSVHVLCKISSMGERERESYDSPSA